MTRNDRLLRRQVRARPALVAPSFFILAAREKRVRSKMGLMDETPLSLWDWVP